MDRSRLSMIAAVSYVKHIQVHRKPRSEDLGAATEVWHSCRCAGNVHVRDQASVYPIDYFSSEVDGVESRFRLELS